MATKKVPASKNKKTVATKKTIKKTAVKMPVKKVVKKSVKKTKTVASIKRHKVSLEKKSSRKKQVSPKRIAYMLLAIILGLLLGMIVYGFVEMIYLKNAYQSGIEPILYDTNGGSTFLPPVVKSSFMFVGLFFGVWLGFWGWRTVYIEHKHRIFKK